MAGAHAGYNWQQGPAVFGVEADLQAMKLQSSMTGGLTYNSPAVPTLGDFAATSSSIDWYGTLRGRLGIGSGPWLLYGTAGLAYGDVGLSSTFNMAHRTLNSQVSELKVGWVAGAGVEYLLRPNASLRLGYQYVDLGTLNLSSSSPQDIITISQTARASAQFHTFMAGMSWRFAPTASSAPWAGGYAGGHLGGAWGNSTDATYNSAILISDMRLKRDIALVGRRGDGLGIYSYKYLWSDTVYVGVMAQEVALVHPEAVVRDDLTGHLGVDYGRLAMRP